MSELARRYAEACFGLSVDAGRFADTARRMEESPLRETMEDPSVDWQEKVRVLDRLPWFSEDAQLLDFYKLLAKKGRMALLPEIAESYRILSLEARNTAVCRMRCVHIPDEAHQKRLVEKLCALHHRDSVLLDIRTDPELVGGFVLTIDGVTYDRSVRGALRDMERQLQERRMI